MDGNMVGGREAPLARAVWAVVPVDAAVEVVMQANWGPPTAPLAALAAALWVAEGSAGLVPVVTGGAQMGATLDGAPAGAPAVMFSQDLRPSARQCLPGDGDARERDVPPGDAQLVDVPPDGAPDGAHGMQKCIE